MWRSKSSETLLLPQLALLHIGGSQCTEDNEFFCFQVLLVDGNGLLHHRGRTALESPALPMLPLEVPVWCPAVTAPCC